MNDLLARKAEPWTYAVGIAGKSFIYLAIVFCLLAAILMWQKRERAGQWSLAIGASGFVGAFGCLLTLFLTHQFHFKYIFEHSATDHELKYLIAGVWSGQEGSFLLWGLMASVVGVIAARGAGMYRRWFTVVYGVFLAALAGILAYESPFRLLEMVNEAGKLVHVVPPEGRGMVPSLLNYWIVIHPPTIFLGFGTLTVLFAYAFAAVLRRELISWVPMVRPWAIFSLAVLGLGLCMGGFWAYETLGWGGFWMWDPVENTSFVPWCGVVVFVHGMFVQQARKKWYWANAIWGALPFALFCYGTLLTRSGWLGDSSVHGFAKMDANALRFLIGVAIAAPVAFITALIVARPPAPKTEHDVPKQETVLNKELFYGIGAWLIWMLAAATALGMSYPLMLRAVRRPPEIIEEHLYHSVLAWLFPPLMIAMAVAPFLNWRGLSFRELFSRITNSLAISIGLVGVLLLWLKSSGFVAPKQTDTINLGILGQSHAVVSWVLFLTGLCMFVAVASFWRMMETWKQSKQSVAAMLSHFGLAVAMMGLIFSRGFEVKEQLWLHPTENPSVFGYSLTNEGQTSRFGDRNNKIAIRATRDKDEFLAKPTLYFFLDANGEPKAMSWPSIIQRGLVDYYFVIDKPVFDATDINEFVLSADPVNNPDVKALKDVVLTYDGYEVEGSITEDGMSTLIAKMTAVTANETYQLRPALIIQPGQQPVEIEARIGDTYKLHLVSMDPETHNIKVWVEYIEPAYPMLVFFKPLTLFVWLGVGIMTLGGLLAAFIRRKERKANATETAA